MTANSPVDVIGDDREGTFESRRVENSVLHLFSTRRKGAKDGGWVPHPSLWNHSLGQLKHRPQSTSRFGAPSESTLSIRELVPYISAISGQPVKPNRMTTPRLERSRSLPFLFTRCHYPRSSLGVAFFPHFIHSPPRFRKPTIQPCHKKPIRLGKTPLQQLRVETPKYYLHPCPRFPPHFDLQLFENFYLLPSTSSFLPDAREPL